MKLFLDGPDTPVERATQVGKGHGRIETRVASVSADIVWLQERHDWLGLQAVGKVTATSRKACPGPGAGDGGASAEGTTGIENEALADSFVLEPNLEEAPP